MNEFANRLKIIGKRLKQVLKLESAQEQVEDARQFNVVGSVKLNGRVVRVETPEEREDVAKEEGEVTSYFSFPPNVSNVVIPSDLPKRTKSMILAIIQDNNINKDMNDDVIRNAMTGRIFQGSYGKALPKDDSYDEGWYPAGGKSGKKVNIEAIKFWVEHTKLASMSDDDIEEEYYQMRETAEFQQFASVDKKIENLLTTMKSKRRNPETTKKLLVDSVAYMVARKLWYAGRKPSSMNDHEWNEHTKYMRPHEGSFGGGDVWKNLPFKYDENYIYRSGEY